MFLPIGFYSKLICCEFLNFNWLRVITKTMSKYHISRKHKMKVNIYIDPNLLLLKENELKFENEIYGKCFQCTIKL